jgi:hypothetical protein
MAATKKQHAQQIADLRICGMDEPASMAAAQCAK